MSESVTLYRISRETFEKLNAFINTQKFNIASAKSYTTFQGSFMALEFVLSKGQDVNTAGILSEIFNPKEVLGAQKFDNLTPDEQFEFYESGNLIPYLDPGKISTINKLLDTFTAEYIHTNYDAEELNDKGIYPSVWHNDNSPNKAFNERQLQEDSQELKAIFKQATDDKDYILVFG